MTKFMFEFHVFFTKAKLTARKQIICAFIPADSVEAERLLRAYEKFRRSSVGPADSGSCE